MAMLEGEVLYGPDGDLIPRYLPVREVAVATQIELSADEAHLVVWDYEEHAFGRGRRRTVDEKCFRAFLGLESASPRSVADFAKKWGMLGLCKHEQPAAGHDLRSIEAQLTSRVLRSRCDVEQSESIESWRRFARQFRSAVQIANALRENSNNRATVELWEVFNLPEDFDRSLASADGQRRLLTAYVNRVLAAATVQPVISWGDRNVLQFGCRGVTRLFSALAFQLAMAVADAKFAWCSHCHRPYEPKRRPRAGEANYCEDAACKQYGNLLRVSRSRKAR